MRFKVQLVGTNESVTAHLLLTEMLIAVSVSVKG